MKLRLAIGVGALTLLTACFPDPGWGNPPSTTTTTTTVANASPAITAFSAVTPSAPSPLTTALTWTISDAENNPLTCRLDLDGNGSYDKTVAACTSESLRTATFTTVGVTTVQLEVSDGISTPATATTPVTVAAASADTFDLQVRLAPGVPAGAADIFEAAAQRWEAVIKTGLPDENVPYPADFCREGTAAIATVDDMLIDFDVQPIDGEGGADANAFTCDTRADGTTILGASLVDSADLQNFLDHPRYFLDVMTHEIGHAIGLVKGAFVDTTTEPGNPVFTGQAANGIFQELGGLGKPPVRNAGDDGSGTPAHWGENVFGIELMTPESPNTEESPLSALSVAALADLGYGVDLAGADPYVLGQTSPRPAARAAGATVNSH